MNHVTLSPFSENSDLSPTDVIRGTGQPVLSLCVSDDGAIVATGMSNGNTLVYRTDLADSVHLYCELRGHQSYVRDIIILYPDLLTASGDGTVKKWHLPSKQLQQNWQGHQGSITLMINHEYSVFTASVDHTIILWNYQNGIPLVIYKGHNGPIGCLDLIPPSPGSGPLLISGSADTTLRIWNAENGSLLAVPGYEIKMNEYGEHYLHVISSTSCHRDAVTCLADFSHNKMICSGSMDSTIRFWMSPTWECVLTLTSHKAAITNLLIPVANGSHLYSSASDGIVIRWSIELEYMNQDTHVCPVAYSLAKFSVFTHAMQQQGRRQSYHLDYQQSFLSSGKQPPETITRFAQFNGNVILGTMNGNVKSFNDKGEILQSLQGHTNAITAVKHFRTRFVLTASMDGTVRFWELEKVLEKPHRKIDLGALMKFKAKAHEIVKKRDSSISLHQPLKKTTSEAGIQAELESAKRPETKMPVERKVISVERGVSCQPEQILTPVTVKTPKEVLIYQKSVEPSGKPVKKIAVKIPSESVSETDFAVQRSEPQVFYVQAPTPSYQMPAIRRPPISLAPHQEFQVSNPVLPPIQIPETSRSDNNMAMMTAAAETAIEKFIQKRGFLSDLQPANQIMGRQSLPPIDSKRSPPQSEWDNNRAWSMTNTRRTRKSYQIDDDDEYFQELDHEPAQVFDKQ